MQQKQLKSSAKIILAKSHFCAKLTLQQQKNSHRSGGPNRRATIMTHDRVYVTCEIICREALKNIAEQSMRYSYACFLLDKQTQLDASERLQYTRTIADMLGD